MGKKILFWPDVYKEQGHWLPTFVWAKGLLQQEPEGSYEVSYMGIPDCKSLVKWFNKDVNKKELYELEENEFQKRYDDLLKYIMEHTTDEKEKQRIGFIFNPPTPEEVAKYFSK